MFGNMSTWGSKLTFLYALHMLYLMLIYHTTVIFIKTGTFYIIDITLKYIFAL